MKLKPWLFAPLLLAGCAAGMNAAHQHDGGPMHMSGSGMSGRGMAGMDMSDKDMSAMCDMHRDMMAGKTPEERQALMDKHMKSMSPGMRQHMQMMQQRCK